MPTLRGCDSTALLFGQSYELSRLRYTISQDSSVDSCQLLVSCQTIYAAAY